MKSEIKIGKNSSFKMPDKTDGGFVKTGDELFYVIKNYDNMQPFFMSIVSNSDHWMYLSSNGSLSAGRANPEQAIFPYYTDDKIHDYKDITGSKTIILATIANESFLWEPFTERYKGVYQTERNIYKNICGNRIIFEEKNHDLNLTFSYEWMNSESYGWIRKSTILNSGNDTLNIKVVDGIQNILPYGVQRNMQGMLSTLVDAYKKSELVDDSSLALFRLSSIPVDKAEPSEALKATTVWSIVDGSRKILLSNKQLDTFRCGETIVTETETRGIKGSYYINHEIDLNQNQNHSWYIIADVAKDSSDIIGLLDVISSDESLIQKIDKDVEEGTKALKELVSLADGLHNSSDTNEIWRHFSNAMFNIMRGGIPKDDYEIQIEDYKRHISHFNKKVISENNEWLQSLPDTIQYHELIQLSNKNGDPDIVRLSTEYMPFIFSRRHGDPSRPWNLFNIKLKNSDGSPILYYQGNWRDIFQNWEALANSYPGFITGMIFKFLNATTIEGYNPYKVTSEGFEWEILDPSDPWSNIGYWGDHQIIYLEKLLELLGKYFPQKMFSLMEQEVFTFANVPYRLKPYHDILKSPKETIVFDDVENEKIKDLVNLIGEDGKLLRSGDDIFRSNFCVKALIPLLTKLSNFIPGAGIWMNTQRPEWNDANNALVGNGASMVTVYYLRRYVNFLIKIFSKPLSSSNWKCPVEVYSFLNEISDALNDCSFDLKSGISNKERKHVLDKLGLAGNNYRDKVYNNMTGKFELLLKDDLLSFLNLVLKFIDQSIAENKRADGLYNAYNLVKINDDEVIVSYLYEMLEGQVAVLSSGYLKPIESLELLDKLRNSKLYRQDQNSYILYPDRKLPSFLNRNNLTKEDIDSIPLLKYLSEKSCKDLLISDYKGNYHFNGEINNSNTLKLRLEKALKDNIDFTVNDINEVIEFYDNMFDHQSFTGRSGTFYKYEGLGCIYWHMVSKLLLAVGENILIAEREKSDKLLIDKLKTHFVNIKKGIGSHKSPEEYGAFPTDPYSHTPSMAGVQQPGMTGQVKEDLLSRLIELGVTINEGKICFKPDMLNINDFIVDTVDNSKFISFSFCGTNIKYKTASENHIVIEMNDGSKLKLETNEIDSETCEKIFLRNSNVKVINVGFNNVS